MRFTFEIESYPPKPIFKRGEFNLGAHMPGDCVSFYRGDLI